MPLDHLLAATQGFALGASLIIAIGAQNAFVLRQGLKRQGVLLVTTICFLCDAVLIALGAGGFAGLVAAVPGLPAVAAWGGAVFLIGYGARAFRAALKPTRLLAGGDGAGLSPPALAGATLAVSLLNPHVYLDTVVLLGSVAAQYPATERIAFALGGIGASAVWFYGLGYGAARLAPIFARPAAWRLLDLAIGTVMWAIAGGLIWGQIAS
jgi:L-lysine exporter family protein LysE/ArgO